jgi:hypothetical protein
LERTEDELVACKEDEEWLQERVATLKKSYRHGQNVIKLLRTKAFDEI